MKDQQWFLNFPIAKAAAQDGQFVIEGIAASPALDIENERVLATGMVDSLPYLEAHGHYNWNHTDLILGDIQKARIVDAEWAQEHFGLAQPPAGKCLYLKGFLYEPNDEMPEEQRRVLQMVRGTLAAGGRMGKSVQGARRRITTEMQPDGTKARVTTSSFISGCAITPCPVNAESLVQPVTLAKSLSEAFALEDTEGTIVVNCPEMEKSLGDLSADKVTQAVLNVAREKIPACEEGGGLYAQGLYEGYIIARCADCLWRIPYSTVGTDVTVGEPVAVHVEYVPDTDTAAETTTPSEPIGPAMAAGLRELAKALTTTETTDPAEMHGGDALRQSTFGRRRKRRKRRPPLGSGERFEELSDKLNKRGVRDPDALAATIGRRKYGKARMARLAAGGERHRAD